MQCSAADKLPEEPRRTPPIGGRAFDPKLALKALRSGSEEDLCAGLATLDSDTSDNPPFEDENLSDLPVGSDRVWQDDGGVWWTDFPPPEGFVGEEQGRWGDDDYARECGREECDLLDRAREAELADCRSDEEAERISFFAGLQADLDDVRSTGEVRPGARDEEADSCWT